MIRTDVILQDPHWAAVYRRIEPIFLRWNQILNTKIEFQYKESWMHSYGHCERVLLYSLLSGYESGLREDNLEALGAASVFHDTRRVDDSIEPAHGHRAAQHYLKDHPTLGLPFYIEAYEAINWHAERDCLGEKDIKATGLGDDAITVYRVFKDADALDRTRFGRHCCASLDPKYLRMPASKALVDLAYQMVDPRPL